MIHSQDSFHELEEILRSLQVYSGDKPATSSDHESAREEEQRDENTNSTAEYNDQLSFEEILMEILLHQKLHTSKEYTLNGLTFKVYVLDDTELWVLCV